MSALDNNSASKSSPKRSPKKSPRSKSSPKSGKRGAAKLPPEPPVETGIQTQPTAICYLCLHEFKSPVNVQAHVLVMDHKAPYSVDLQHCRACQSDVMLKDVERHKCAGYKALFLEFVSNSAMLDFGPPYRCLYCRSEPLASRVSLAMHLLSQHNPGKKPGRCGMCEFAYAESGTGPGRKASPGKKKSPGRKSPSPGRKSTSPSKKKSPGKSSPKGKKSPGRKASPGRAELDSAQQQRPPDPFAEVAAEPVVLSAGQLALAKHVEAEHVPGYTLLYRRLLSEDSFKRLPYSCPICCCRMSNNHDMHAHIIGCHANSSAIDSELHLCAVCGFAAANLSGLNQHVLAKHTAHLKQLGLAWIRHQLLMNATDLANVCAFCWQCFKHDFQLQAHLLVAHTSGHPLRCGWCRTDFLSCPDPVLAMMLMQNHEFNHGLDLHKVALELGLTGTEMDQPLPEVGDKALLIADRLEDKKKEKPGQKSKKSPGKGSKSSPKSKKSPSSKRSNSPKSSKKSKS